MEKMNSCFFCTTPYQIMNAVSMAISSTGENDLYIVPQFKGASEYYKNIIEEKIFDNVILVDTSEIERYKNSKSKIGLYGGIVKNYININSIIKKILRKNTIYRNIFISSKANIGRLVCLYYIRKKYPAKIYYFDDGEGSYFNSDLYAPSKVDGMIRRVLFGKKSLQISNTIYLRSPELFREINNSSSLKIHKIKKLNADQIEVLNRICGYTEQGKIEKNCICLDILADSVFEAPTAQKYASVMKNVDDIFGDDMIYKKHPRDKAVSTADEKIYRCNDIPFEVICANSSMDNKVLITVASTAVTTPKLLLDQEPYLILLYRLFRMKLADQAGRDAYYNAVRKIYKDKERIFIPGSTEELYDICRRLSKRS